MSDFSIGRSATLVLRTYPFMLIRAAVYLGISAAVVVAAGGGAGFGWAIGAISGVSGRAPGAFWGAIAGCALVALLLWWLREYILFLVRAGHVAAMLLADDELPAPATQGIVGQALALVQQRFREIHTLLAIARCVHGSLATIVAIIDPVAKVLPAEARSLAGPINATLGASLGFLTDVVLAKPLSTRRGNAWSEARDAVLLLAQTREVTMRNAFQLAAISWCITFVIFLIALTPASSLAQAHPSGAGPITLLFAGIFAWSCKQAFIEPFVIGSMLQAYLRAIAGQRPDPGWDASLTEASEPFRELKARATGSSRASRRAAPARD
jgi:hypothetical protein